MIYSYFQLIEPQIFVWAIVLPIRVNLSQNLLKSRFQVPPGNAMGAALEQVREALPPNRHSQSLTGNEVTR
ncbi:MAG: hypothetical protein ACREPR_06140 [Brasilonema sp.]